MEEIICGCICTNIIRLLFFIYFLLASSVIRSFPLFYYFISAFFFLLVKRGWNSSVANMAHGFQKKKKKYKLVGAGMIYSDIIYCK